MTGALAEPDKYRRLLLHHKRLVAAANTAQPRDQRVEGPRDRPSQLCRGHHRLLFHGTCPRSWVRRWSCAALGARGGCRGTCRAGSTDVAPSPTPLPAVKGTAFVLSGAEHLPTLPTTLFPDLRASDARTVRLGADKAGGLPTRLVLKDVA